MSDRGGKYERVWCNLEREAEVGGCEWQARLDWAPVNTSPTWAQFESLHDTYILSLYILYHMDTCIDVKS